MRARDFLAERWTAATLRNYFDNKRDKKFTKRDVTVSEPLPGCILLQYKTVPDVARSFYRVAEYYDGKHYGGRPHMVSLVDFLDRKMDRDGDTDYFKFWDGFNIPDHAFRAWRSSVGQLTQAEQIMVDAVDRTARGRKKYCVIGVGGKDPATVRHEMFHARYYLDDKFRSAAKALISANARNPIFRSIKTTLIKKLDYEANVDEEAAAYLYTDSQMRLVFGTEAKDLVNQFKTLDQSSLAKDRK